MVTWAVVATSGAVVLAVSLWALRLWRRSRPGGDLGLIVDIRRAEREFRKGARRARKECDRAARELVDRVFESDGKGEL